ncbi:MAG TPA: rod shape-determining protein MreC [Terrimicrobiaceae bacterium]|jgi:rod shape-determining protein MreC|nr:rod shape-determining protein MreC [Terrimicrobiaceae bacterium]
MSRLNIVLVAAVIVGAIILSSFGSGTMRRLQAGFLSAVSPFLKTGSAVQRQLGAMGKGLKTLDELEAENRQLKIENTELRATNQILRDLEAENNKLRSALEYRKRSIFKLVPARIVSRDAATWWSTVKINRGFEEGLEPDQPVLTDIGLVGKTTTVSKNESIVLLISDESCKVAAKVEGSNERGILSGRRMGEGGSPNEMQLNFLSKKADLQPGQKVYTEGVVKGTSTGVFPSGILIGAVKSFQARPLDGQAIVEPSVDLSTVEDVFVVVGAK